MTSETDLVFGRTVVPVPLPDKPLKKSGLGFEYAEHSYIGDAISLTLADGRKVPAHDHKFTLRNGLVATYGQINALGGDFYGTDKPISDGADPQDQSNRFNEAYNTLADASSRQPKEAQAILAVLQAEVDAVNNALFHHEDPSIAYNKLIGVTAKLEALTLFRPPHFPSYLGLALINWDHFGQNARTTYDVGHGLAIQAAVSGDLEYAYTLNAFADHFLEDSFSAGHLRTPRKDLHKERKPASDLCAKFMHDEDCAIGLSVQNTRGESWTCYGDKRALDKDDAKNLKYCIAAVQASADEIYEAYKTKTPPRNYGAWDIAPTLESAMNPSQVLVPLFKYNNNTRAVDRRKVIKNRRIHDLTSSWRYEATVLKCIWSGWWKYPIMIDGPPKITPNV